MELFLFIIAVVGWAGFFRQRSEAKYYESLFELSKSYLFELSKSYESDEQRGANILANMRADSRALQVRQERR